MESKNHLYFLFVTPKNLKSLIFSPPFQTFLDYEYQLFTNADEFLKKTIETMMKNKWTTLGFINQSGKNSYIGQSTGFMNQIAEVNIVKEFQGKNLCKPLIKFSIQNFMLMQKEELKTDDISIGIYMHSKMPFQACNCYIKAGLELGLYVYQSADDESCYHRVDDVKQQCHNYKGQTDYAEGLMIIYKTVPFKRNMYCD